jgi:hypothetical protein
MRSLWAELQPSPTPDLDCRRRCNRSRGDDETVLAAASDVIQRFGNNALVASNGVDALEIFRRTKT